ncbi:LOW QUALITY PROTEIN: hypothetical protein V2J09_006642 [Rumex salicifolius]
MVVQGDGASTVWTNLLGAMGTGHLPGDLMVEILGRLPVESIIRLKSVCRAWYALFRNPIFIQHQCHLAGSSAVMTNLLSLIIHTFSPEGNDNILSLLLDHSYDNLIMKPLIPSFECDMNEIQVVGSINGLVCLSICSNATCIMLWNPAIREHSQIPNPRLIMQSEERVSLGFAYDKTMNTYKVVRVLYSKHFSGTMSPARVEIYSTGTNTWRPIQVCGFPWLCFQKTCNTLVGGIPYWYAVELQEQGSIFRELMTWFDAADESFKFHPLPCYHDLSGFRMRLGVMGDHPIVIVYSIEMQQNGRVEIWKLNKCNDGGQDLLFWKKILTVEPVSGLERIIGCWRNGEIIAENKDGALFIYDPLPKQIKELPSCGSWGFLEMKLATLRDGVDIFGDDLAGSIGTTKLCGELMIEVLIRLPIISILRLKSVCKAWYNLFASTMFIRHHSPEWKNQIFSLLLANSSENPILKGMKFPLTGQLGYIQILGSINGLICLNLCPKATFIVLWNPATRRCRRIPYPQLESEREESVSLGFSYDEKTDCYKIVRILSFAATPISESPWLGLKSTTLEQILEEQLISLISLGFIILAVTRMLLLTAYLTEPGYFQDLIVWFDASTEAFRFHALQAAGTDMGEQPVLTFMKYTISPCGLEWVDLRKLNNFDGGKDSFRVEELSVKPPPNFMHVIGFWRNGEMIAADHDSALFLYGNEESRRLASYSGGFPYVYHYNESLVWPSTLKKMRWNDLLDATATPQLPSDIMIQILPRLPIKSILRFKSVNKAWCALFTSPNFILNHTRIGSSASNVPSLLVQTHNREGNAEIRLLDSPRDEPVLTDLILPFETTAETELVGSINGLVCLSLCSSGTSIVFWNPATRKHARLPKPQLPTEGFHSISVGFAYDDKTDCYKVVRIFYARRDLGNMQPAGAEIYNSGTNTWTLFRSSNFPWLGFQTKCYSVIHGSPYWLAVSLSTEHGIQHGIMRFDASTEEFRFRRFEIGEPFWMRRIGMGVEEGNPVVFALKNEITQSVNQSSIVDTWKLDKSGGELHHSTIVTRHILRRLLGIWRNGEMIAFDENMKLVLYDPKSDETRYLPTPPCDGSMDSAHVCEYTPTLVSPYHTSA